MRSNLLFMLSMILIALEFLFVSDQAGSLDITSIIQGTIKATNDHFIKIIEGPNDKEAQIAIDPNTVYDNVQGLKDLKAGDRVQIDYKADHNKSTAITITKVETEGVDVL